MLQARCDALFAMGAPLSVRRGVAYFLTFGATWSAQAIDLQAAADPIKAFFSSGMAFFLSGREKSYSVDQNFINGKQKSYSGALICCIGMAFLLSRIRNRCSGIAIFLSGREILYSRIAFLSLGKALRDPESRNSLNSAEPRSKVRLE